MIGDASTLPEVFKLNGELVDSNSESNEALDANGDNQQDKVLIGYDTEALGASDPLVDQYDNMPFSNEENSDLFAAEVAKT